MVASLTSDDCWMNKWGNYSWIILFYTTNGKPDQISTFKPKRESTCRGIEQDPISQTLKVLCAILSLDPTSHMSTSPTFVPTTKINQDDTIRWTNFYRTKNKTSICYSIIQARQPRRIVWWIGWKSKLTTFEPWLRVRTTVFGISSWGRILGGWLAPENDAWSTCFSHEQFLFILNQATDKEIVRGSLWQVLAV